MPPRIGLFGGSFDPPHLGHLIAAQAAVEQLQLDLVLWIPTGSSYHKAGTSSTDQRVRMTELAIRGNDSFLLSMVDAKRSGPTYSIDTVSDIRAAHPDSELVFLVGEDAWADVPNWHRSEELRELVTFAVVSRGGSTVPSQKASLRWVEIPLIGISSSECRQRVRNGLSLQYWVAETVRDYIAEHDLYTEKV